jgi:four helix bundle protein
MVKSAEVLVVSNGLGCATRIGIRKAFMDKVKKPIKSFQDLDVYQGSYKAMLSVFKHILPKLPKEEEYDLKDQLRRSAKAIPRLIAEGHAKRHQKKGFQKYLDDAMAESNETIVSLSQAKDVYYSYVDVNVCNELIDIYDKTSRQLYNLSLAWTKFGQRKERPNRETIDETSSATE